MLNPLHLEYYITIVQEGSVSAASKKLFISQPFLSRVIKSLEAELNTVLIHRTTRSFFLTEAGEILYNYAINISRQQEEVYGLISNSQNIKTGEVLFSCPGVLLDCYFSNLLNSFYNKYPNISISIVEEGSKLVAESIRGGTVDLGMVMLPIADINDFYSYSIIQDTIYILLSESNPLAQQESVNLSDLRQEPLIIYSNTATLHDQFIAACNVCGFMPNILYKSLMPNFTVQMVSLGLVSSIMPRPLIQRYIADGLVARPLNPVLSWEIALICKKDRYLSHATKCLLQHIYEFFTGSSSPLPPLQ